MGKIPMVLCFLVGVVLLTSGVAVSPVQGSKNHHYDFFIRESNYTRLCHERSILAVNGQFPGPTIYARKGDVVVVNVYNQGDKNITIHWHGVSQPRNPWSDGPEYITQCPIQPGGNFTYRIILSEEEGTLWWHAHSGYDRTTVHGAIVIHPKIGTTFPFKKPHKKILPIILGEWWNEDVNHLLEVAMRTGGEVNISEANTINGQPGDLFPCSRNGTFKLSVQRGETYLLRIINAGLSNDFFFGVAGHRLTVVGTDAHYTKLFTVEHIMISSGQTVDALLEATNGSSNGRYYMTARTFESNTEIKFNNSTATAILEYTDAPRAGKPHFPSLPAIDDMAAGTAYTAQLRSLGNNDHPVDLPMRVDEHMLITLAVNMVPCAPNATCGGPDGNDTRFAASLNNVSFVNPSIDILDAYYGSVHGVYKGDFPDMPPFLFNFTDDNIPKERWLTKRGSKVKVLEYGTVVEVVFQDTAIIGAENHPMHLHGFSFYVVGRGFGNFDEQKDPNTYNLVDPPYQNTVSVPKAGWAAIRFRATNPGVWFMHCHFDRHLVWGMDTVFIVKNGKARQAKILRRPSGMPKC